MLSLSLLHGILFRHKQNPTSTFIAHIRTVINSLLCQLHVDRLYVAHQPVNQKKRKELTGDAGPEVVENLSRRTWLVLVDPFQILRPGVENLFGSAVCDSHWSLPTQKSDRPEHQKSLEIQFSLVSPWTHSLYRSVFAIGLIYQSHRVEWSNIQLPIKPTERVDSLMMYPSDHNRRFCYRATVSHRFYLYDRKYNSIIYGGASGPVRPLLGRNSPVNAVLALSHRIVYAKPVGPHFSTVPSACYIASIDVIENKPKCNYLRRIRSGVVHPTGCR